MPTSFDADWLAAFADAVRAAAAPLVAAAGGHDLRVTMEVGEGPEAVLYHLCIDHRGVEAGPGPAPDAHLTFRQGRSSAEAVAAGTLDAQSAFLHGQLRVEGDVRRLVDQRLVFEVLADALAPLRAVTDATPVPELPEVQAHAERLDAWLAGATLESFTPLTFMALKTAVPAPALAVGRTLEGVGRRGKYLLLRTEPLVFVVHLMQGGRLKVDAKPTAKPRGGLARWRFDDERGLLLTEAGKEHRAGVWTALPTGLEEQPPLAGLGPEADQIGPEELAERFAAHHMRLHGFLRDQRMVAGIGRRLANEVCHHARLSPFAATGKLGLDGATRVVEAIRATVAEGLAYERTRDDMSASKDRPGAVHGRAGQACPVCGDAIRSVSYASYTVAYCPTCQTGGKVLADNTTSRFLK